MAVLVLQPDSRPASASKAERVATRPPDAQPQQVSYHPPALDQAPFEPPSIKTPDVREQNVPTSAQTQYQSLVHNTNQPSLQKAPAAPVQPLKVPPVAHRPQPQKPVETTPQITDKMSALNLHEFSKVKR